jgi:hypothetical protein
MGAESEIDSAGIRIDSYRATTNLSVAPHGRACPSRASRWRSRRSSWGFPCSVVFLASAPSPLPRRNRGSDRSCRPPRRRGDVFPTTAAFPVIQAGRLPHCPFRRPARRSLALRPACSRNRHAILSIKGSDGFVASAAASIATGRSDPIAGRDLHPMKHNSFSRRTE